MKEREELLAWVDDAFGDFTAGKPHQVVEQIKEIFWQVDCRAKDAAEAKSATRIADLERQLAEAKAAVPVWQPIETAPKDGTEVFLWLPSPYERIEKARWFDLWENWQLGEFPDDSDEYCGIGSALPTHWMPLPAAPIAVAEQTKRQELKPEKVEWSYSTNGENYYGTEDSREDAIALALEEVGETEGSFWIGKNRRHFGRGTCCTEPVIEMLQEQAYEDCGEFAETYLDGVTKEEEKELADYITSWAARVDRSNFWTVFDTEQIDIAEAIAAMAATQPSKEETK